MALSFDSNASPALHTDLYQLTMLQAYQRENMDATAVFSLFVRRLKQRNYLLACGLDTVLSYLEGLRFTASDRDYLRSLDDFDDDFVDGLADFRFTGDVYAVPEGTPVFANEPLLEVVAPIGEAQLVETFLLNQITYQTGYASKAARVKQAATIDGTDRTVADFGMRRMHGADATLKAARAGYIAGIDATSNVAAGQTYGLPVTGTMAHSYIEAHEHEQEAFDAFADLYPRTVLLVDTYDTLDGVRRVVKMAKARGDDFQVRGIRLDSGDLGELARKSRAILDEAGLEDVNILASGGLDEHRIAELVQSGAPIDGFGVGTKLGTMEDQPYLDSAYKLAGYDGTPRMKLAPNKKNLPGRKQVYRSFDDNGTATGDVITTADASHGGEPLLQCVMRNGERTEAAPSLAQSRTYAHDALAALPEALHALEKADTYPVDVSQALKDRASETEAALKAAHDLP
ncbi:MAG: nicotinate phosphoribosyltransferase [Longimonas sp.]|uniref:nicotinate phosphoribosyltransferase n=1 Tax=Longimonas sp. TaxID=2039626 RepID=UPI00335751C3